MIHYGNLKERGGAKIACGHQTTITPAGGGTTIATASTFTATNNHASALHSVHSCARTAPEPWQQPMELVSSGQTEAALASREEQVSTDLKNKDCRFELALTLFKPGRDFRANWHLERVCGASLTAGEPRMVDRVLAHITARSV